ncbi:unnamed protein product [Vitrella brassicaformis CCMP3155]|uniref:Uncharacterized protein n=1 Tax=Vitrella brassicaformis (strain CCMP3155) TaxID=1169540 RepID=A0A0G4EKU9_VITBC|nr:unnamed protein product [Vitrella brassicaformis CCMP3155]|eukprot:CEL97320.1 unnamed protein product [Vitrella brassicaformis CCMP3155]
MSVSPSRAVDASVALAESSKYIMRSSDRPTDTPVPLERGYWADVNSIRSRSRHRLINSHELAARITAAGEAYVHGLDHYLSGAIVIFETASREANQAMEVAKRPAHQLNRFDNAMAVDDDDHPLPSRHRPQTSPTRTATSGARSARGPKPRPRQRRERARRAWAPAAARKARGATLTPTATTHTSRRAPATRGRGCGVRSRTRRGYKRGATHFAAPPGLAAPDAHPCH